MKKEWLLAMIFVSFQAFSSFEQIPSHNMNFYHKSFPDAVFQQKVLVYDPITKDGVNNFFLKIFNKGNEFLGNIRDIETTPGCNNHCSPLSFTLAYQKDGSFKEMIIRDQEPLMKEYGSVDFTQEDYDRIDNSLKSEPESFKMATTPEDLVDGVSGATKLEYMEDVVKTAALSHYRIYQYNKQTLKDIESEKAGEILSAIDFSLPDQSSNMVNFNYGQSGEFKNKITVMLFFATWCSYCNQEIPQFEQLYQKYKNNSKVRLIAVRTSRARETENYNDFLKRHGINFQILNDNPREVEPYNKVGKLYNIKYIPKTFIFSKDGTVIPYPDIEDTSEYFSSLDNLLKSLIL